jgi:hypothetical protein
VEQNSEADQGKTDTKKAGKELQSGEASEKTLDGREDAALAINIYGEYQIEISGIRAPKQDS